MAPKFSAGQKQYMNILLTPRAYTGYMDGKLTFPLRSAFVALPLDDASAEVFRALQLRLAPFADILSLQNPASPHLTLQFWPSLMEIEYDQVLLQAAKIAANHAPFSVRTNGIDAFASSGRHRVLFFDVAFSDELARVKKSCPWPNVKPFTPHVTLARIRHPEKFSVHKKKVMKALEDSEFRMNFDRVRLYAQIDGVNQTPLEDFVFSK